MADVSGVSDGGLEAETANFSLRFRLPPLPTAAGMIALDYCLEAKQTAQPEHRNISLRFPTQCEFTILIYERSFTTSKVFNSRRATSAMSLPCGPRIPVTGYAAIVPKHISVRRAYSTVFEDSKANGIIT